METTVKVQDVVNSLKTVMADDDVGRLRTAIANKLGVDPGQVTVQLRTEETPERLIRVTVPGMQGDEIRKAIT